MKKDSSNQKDLENLVRKGLKQVNQQPDSNTWSRIAAQQNPANLRLKARYYGQFALPVLAVLLLAGIGWWYSTAFNTGTPAPEPVRQAPVSAHDQPVASIPPAQAPEAGEPVQAPALQPKAQTRLTKLNAVPASTVSFHAEAGMKYQNPATGTQVTIPPNALVDQEGRPVQGASELMIREYRDIADFLASGIPMHYTDERGTFFFNSGGMFEVRVSQNGAPLQMAPGQQYLVEFRPTGTLTNASLYYLEDDSEAWQYVSSQAFNPDPSEAQASQPPVIAENLAIRNNRNNLNLDCLPPIVEIPRSEDPTAWIQSGVQMGYDLAFGKKEMPVWFRKKPDRNIEQVLMSMERGLIHVVRHQDLGEMFFPEDLNNVFTELKAFKNCYFIRTGDSLDTRKKLDPDIYWDRITIKQDIGASCLISLFNEKEGLMQFYATLTGSIGNQTFDSEQVFQEYNRLRTERQNDFESLVISLQHFQFTAHLFKTEQEWCMGQAEWLEYFEQNKALMRKRYAALIDAGLATDKGLAKTRWAAWKERVREMYFNQGVPVTAGRRVNDDRANLTYALRLTSFGIYNCDQIFRMGAPEPDYIYAAYETADGNRVYASQVSVLERRSRLFFTLPSAAKMLRAPNRSLEVVITDIDGRHYHLSAEQYTRLIKQTDQSGTFTVTDITDRTRTPRDWATYLDM
ncbi:MAG: hypothetical protein EP344_11235 [Bacteroidetes bacterium]|nr:MAG: hypothetical protein EP344_11235 [Bacteroidota bacterium]